MKRPIATIAAVVIGVATLTACKANPVPTTREECISQGYEWEEDSSGGECDTDDDSKSYYKNRRTKSSKPNKATTQRRTSKR